MKYVWLAFATLFGVLLVFDGLRHHRLPPVQYAVESLLFVVLTIKTWRKDKMQKLEQVIWTCVMLALA